MMLSSSAVDRVYRCRLETTAKLIAVWTPGVRPPRASCRRKARSCAYLRPRCSITAPYLLWSSRDGGSPRCDAAVAPRSADSCRKLIEGGAEERVAALRDGRRIQRATVAGEPREPLAVYHGRRVERGEGIPVGHRNRRPPGLSLPALQHMGWRVLAVLKRHLHPKAAEIDSRITNPGYLPVDQRDATVALPQHVAAPDVAMQEHRRGRGHAMRHDPLVGLLQQRCRRRPAPPAVGCSVVGGARPGPVRQGGLWR